MTLEEIRKKKEDIDQRLKEHDAARKLIEAERLFIQHICPHPNAHSWDDGGGYGGPSFSSTHWKCPDCGKYTVT